MNKLIIALAAVTLAASPALAKSKNARAAANPNWQAQQDDGPYAYVPPGSARSVPAGMIESSDGYGNTDPDPFVWQQLQRDPDPATGGN